MKEKSIIKSFLKGIFGSEKVYSEPTQADPPSEPPTLTTPPAIVSKTPKPKSEAYLNRKKGRPVHPTALGHLPLIINYLVPKGEVAPSVMAQELGLPKSTLIYNLNLLLAIFEGKGDYYTRRAIQNILGGKRVERVGAGKYVRYRIVDIPQAEPTTPQEG
jgi:hypothetical protein